MHLTRSRLQTPPCLRRLTSLSSGALATFLVGAALAQGAGPDTPAGEPPAPVLPDDYGGFVKVEDGRLTLNGGTFAFAGANSYSMLYSREQAEEQMRIAQSLGLNAIRFWGFWDGEQPTLDADGNPTLPPGGTDKWGRPVLQSTPRAYGEDAFRNMDYVIYLAHLYGIKLVIPLLNEWDEFGGLKQYMLWNNVDIPPDVVGCGPEGEDICFYENEDSIKSERFKFFTECAECQAVYFDYIRTVLNRVNTFTGVAYKDDPAIMIWEVMNEPRFGPWEGDPTAEVIRDFVQESARVIKSVDTRHLVASGEEGFLAAGETTYSGYAWTASAGEGSSFTMNTSIPEIDVATFHGWPFNWAMAGDGYEDRIAEFMPEWITEHARLAKSLKKPLYLGEFGWQILRREGSDLPERDALMSAAYSRAVDEDLDGIMYWHITASHNPGEAIYDGPINRSVLDSAIYFDTVIPHDQEFRFDVYCPEDVSTCDIIEEKSKPFLARVETPDPPFSSICVSPRSECGTDCIELASSPTHCGSCNNTCQTGESCESGVCAVRTPPVWGENDTPYDTSGCQMSQAGVGQTPGQSIWWLGIGGLSLALAGRVIRAAKAR